MIKWIKEILGIKEVEAKVIQKTVTKNGVGYAPKIEPVITEVKKVSVKPKATKPKATTTKKATKPKATTTKKEATKTAPKKAGRKPKAAV
jgi:hypothetical protein